MSQVMISKKQKDLFDQIALEGVLIFASGVPGISANLVGQFRTRIYKNGKEDRLDLGDGTNHVHIDWSRVKRCEIGEFHGEGMLTFFDGDSVLFKLYKPEGKFSSKAETRAGDLS